MKRRWLFWLLVVGFFVLVATHFTEIEKLGQTLAGGQWQWIAAAALLQLGYYVVYTSVFSSAFDTAGVRSRVFGLMPVVFVSLFVNLVAPSGGASGAALFVDDAKRRGQSGARTAAGVLLAQTADFASFALVLVGGMAYLFNQGDLQNYEIAGSILLLAIILTMAAVFVLGLARPQALTVLLSWVQRTVDGIGLRVAHRPVFAEQWASDSASEFREAAVAIAGHPWRLARTVGIGLTAHGFDLATIYVLFLAFGQRVGLGELVAGFAIGVLFWIVSITPQGVGVVEGAMALVYTSLGVPAAQATVVSLAFRGLTFWLPMALGFVLLRTLPAFRSAVPAVNIRSGRHGNRWGVRTVALLTGAMGIINVLSAVTPSLLPRLQVLEAAMPFAVRHGGRLAASLAGFALILLARGLWRRKHVAWLVTLFVLAISATSHLIKGLDVEEAILALALLAVLWMLRREFHARSDPPSLWQGARAVALAIVFTLAYGVAGFYLLDRHFSVHFGLWDAVKQTVVMFTQFYDPGLEPITGMGRYFAGSIYVVGAVTGGYGLLMLLRPVLQRSPATRGEREWAAGIVAAHGRTAIARFTLFEDKSYFFSEGGSVIAYVVKGRVALTLGDPIGPRDDAAAAITAFQDLCSRNDWLPAFYQTLPDYLPAYRAAGFDALTIGEEGIVDLQEFNLAGGANKKLRLAYNRFTKGGYRAEMHEAPLPESLVRELREVSEEWLGVMHGTEKGFSLGWFDEAYIREAPVMALRRPEGEILAFANIQPEYQANEATIDLMRHRRVTEAFTMEFLFLSLFEWARGQGYASFNLGLSSLAGVGEESDDPAVERALHYIYEHMNQFYNFEGLHAFKEKFHPRWEPRYLVYHGAGSLPAVAMAMIRADSGDDFAGEYLRELADRLFRRRAGSKGE